MAIQFDNSNTGVVTLRPATSGTVTLTLPSADGTNGQALTTNGSGQLAFTTVGGAEADTLATVTGRGATTATAVVITNSTASTTTSTGALTVAGGVGVAGALQIGGNLTSNNSLFTIGVSPTGAFQSGKSIKLEAGSTLASDYNGGDVTIKGGNGAEYTSAGAVVITGGNADTGNGGGLYLTAGNCAGATGASITINPAAGFIGNGGSIVLQAGANAGLGFANVQITRTTASTSTTTGALTVAGGLGVAGAIYAGNIFSNGVQLAPASAGQSFITAMVFGGI
jgi:hypothetical protein